MSRWGWTLHRQPDPWAPCSFLSFPVVPGEHDLVVTSISNFLVSLLHAMTSMLMLQGFLVSPSLSRRRKRRRRSPQQAAFSTLLVSEAAPGALVPPVVIQACGRWSIPFSCVCCTPTVCPVLFQVLGHSSAEKRLELWPHVASISLSPDFPGLGQV